MWINKIFKIKKILHIFHIVLVFLTIFAWMFSDFAYMINLSVSDPDRWGVGVERGVGEAEAAGEKKIEQQINIIATTTVTAGAINGIVCLDTTKYNGATFYFEVVGSVTSGTGSAALTHGAGACGTIPSGGSSVTISDISTTLGRYRSSSFTPTSGQRNAYISGLGGTGISIKAARIIIVQQASSITDTQTQIEIGAATSTQQTASTTLQNPKYFYYDSSKFNPDPSTTATFQATMKLSGAGGGCGKGTSIGGGQCRDFITAPGASTWQVPSDWTSANKIEVIGAGGGSMDGLAGGGGGGGAYAYYNNLSGLSPGQNIDYMVATSTAMGYSGSPTWFNSTTCATASVCANGGLSGTGQTGGAGGNVITGTGGNIGGTGGNGQAGPDDGGGGGGGAGGPDGAGENGGSNDGSAGDGGGGGGGAGGISSGPGTNGSGDTGGDGGPGPDGTGGGQNGGPASNGTADTGGGGGGADDAPQANGGDGATYALWGSGYGPGGGGGGGADNGEGGNGGNYGGGGGGQGEDGANGTTLGKGGQGIIVITYTKAVGATTGYAQLYNRTDGTYVAGSLVATTSTAWVLATSSPFTLTSGKEYEVRIASAEIANAKIVLTQSGTISKLQTVQQYINALQTQATATYTGKDGDNQFNPNNFQGMQLKYFYEATMKTSAGTGYARLWDETNSKQLAELAAVSTSYVRRRTDNFASASTTPTSAATLDTQLKNSATNTTSAASSWLIIEISNLVDSTLSQSGFRWFNNLNTKEGGGELSGGWGTSGNGTSTYNSGAGSDVAYAIAIDSDRNIYVAGYASSTAGIYTGKDWLIIKYNSSGQVDTSWGNYGSTTLDASGIKKDDEILALTIDPDKNLYAVGYYYNNLNNKDWRVVKFTSTGQVDTSWATNGSTTYGSSLYHDDADAIAIDSDRNIYVGGISVLLGYNGEWRIIKYNSSGQVDTSWGTNGSTTYVNPGSSGNWAEVNAIAIDSDRNIYAAGYESIGGGSRQDWLIFKYNSSGKVDTSWGNYGSTTLQAVSGWYDEALSIAIDSDRNIYTAGYFYSALTGTDDWRIVKYNSSGQVDTFWGTNGSTTYNSGGSNDDYANAITIDSDRNIYVAGEQSTNGYDWLIAKYTSSGVLASGWGTSGNGTSTYDSGTGSDYATAITIDSDRNIYVAGSQATNGGDWRIAKYQGGGAMVGEPMAAINATSSLSSVAQSFRLRMLIHAANYDLYSGTTTPEFKLQYVDAGTGSCASPSGGTPASYTDVTGSTLIAYKDNTALVDKDLVWATSTDPIHSTDLIIHETYEEANNFWATTTVYSTQDGLWDFSLKENGTASTTYCFRAVKSDDTALTYNYYAAVNGLSPPEIEMSGYRWFGNYDGTMDNGILADGWGTSGNGTSTYNSGAGSDWAYAITIDSDKNIYVAGYQSVNGGEWLIAKYTPSGVLAAGWGTSGNGTSTYDAGTGYEIARAITIDSDKNIYVAGEQDRPTGGYYYDWLIAKYTSSGVLADGWGTSGNGTSTYDSGGYNDYAYAITIDSDKNIYVAGRQPTNGDDWLIAKYGGGAYVGNPLTTQNASTTLTSANEKFRLRTLLRPSGNDLATSYNFKLQYAEKVGPACNTNMGTTDEVYANVTSSSTIAYYNNDRLVDGDWVSATTTDPTHGLDTIVYQTYQEINDFSATTTVESDQNGLWDFSLYDYSAPASTTYCFRAVYSSGSLLATYTYIPEITTAVPPDMTQSAYRWFENSDTKEGGGDVDTAWGSNGSTTFSSSGTYKDEARSIAIDSDRNIYVAGNASSTAGTITRQDWQIIKYNASGQVDTSWGTNGSTTYTSEGPYNDFLLAITIDSDKNIYAAGTYYSSGESDWRIAKYNSSGQVDTSWGTNGSTTYNSGGANNDGAYAITIDSDRNIYVAGYQQTNWYDWRIAKYNSNGQVDTSWGTNGSTTYDSGVVSYYDIAYGIAIDSDRNIYVAGTQGTNNYDWRIAKYNSTGQLDTSWGTSGIVNYNSGGNADEAMAITIDTDRNIYVAGIQGTNGFDWRIAKYTSTGQVATSWGTNGSTTYNSSGTNGDEAVAITIDSDRNIYAAGFAYDSADWRIAKYNSIGQVDTSWGSNGSTTYSSAGANNDWIRAINIDADRNIYAAGYHYGGAGTGEDWRIAKYQGGGAVVGEPMAVVNATSTLTSAGQAFRLRMLLHASGNNFTPGSINLKLQHASTTNDNCESPTSGSWVDVDSLTKIAYKNNPTLVDQDLAQATSTDPTHSTDLIVHQTYEESNNFTATTTYYINQDGLWDFSLYDNGAPAETTYCFRAVESDNTPLSTYSYYPAAITYGVPTVSCTTAPSATDFVLLTPDSITVSDQVIWATSTCNSGTGCALHVQDAGNGSSPGLNKTSGPAYLILSQDDTLETYQDGYGIQMATTSYGTGEELALSPKYDKTGNDVGGFTLFNTEYASSTNTYTDKEVITTYKATISATAYGGDYADTVKYSCVGN